MAEDPKAKAVGEKSATSPREHSEDGAGSIETSGEVRAWLRSNAVTQRMPMYAAYAVITSSVT